MNPNFKTDQITAKVIQDSYSPDDVRITTWEVEVPKFLLAEINTHRAASRNYQSSRAVPVKRMIELVNENPFIPVFWGKNEKGMVAYEECTNTIGSFGEELTREDYWLAIKDFLVRAAGHYGNANYHKQIVNRILEVMMMTRGVITLVDTDNFYNLRLDGDAQPEFQVLTNAMKQSQDDYRDSIILEYGEWHVPYVDRFWDHKTDKLLYLSEGKEVTAEEAKVISAASCAQVSYRRLDKSQEKAIEIFEKLNLTRDNPKAHYSPTEHQARPLEQAKMSSFADPLTTHISRDGWAWSGNLRGYGQFRKEIEAGIYVKN